MEKVVLPVIKLFKQDPTNRLYCWSDHYGALVIASQYCGIKITLNKRYKYFCWHHGCHGPWESVHPGIITFNSPNKELLYFVGNDDQERFLKRNGYKSKAIGLPIIYAPKPKLQRFKNSLLIMPSHTLLGQKDVDDRAVSDYVTFVSQYLKYFDRVAVCIHHSCIRNGLWINEFQALGIEIIEGARTDDENALLRQLSLFTQFESMTTNNWGSHVAYALYCGCKVAICGRHYEKSYSDALKDTTWARNEDVLRIFRSQKVRLDKEAYLADFYRFPHEAVLNSEIGNYLVGAYNKVSPAEMRSLFVPSLNARIKFEVNHVLKRLLTKIYKLSSRTYAKS